MRWREDIYKVNDIINYMAIVTDSGELIMPIEMFNSKFVNRLINIHSEGVSKAMCNGVEIAKEAIKECNKKKYRQFILNKR